MKKFMTSCVTILALANLTYSKPQSPMSAREIIDRMAEVYASCRTYADEGEVFIGLGDKGTSHFRGQSFFTTFVRPSSFRFELWPPGHKEGGDIFIAWKDGELEELLKAKLESLKTSALSGKLGRSDQYDALMATLKELFDEEDIRPIIIFQTDGDQLDRFRNVPDPTLIY